MLISLVAITPIVALIILVILSRKSFLESIILSLIILLFIATLAWGMPNIIILASAIRGFFIALEIILIIFGALLIFGIFQKLKGPVAAKYLFNYISPNYHIQAILIAWTFVSFLEGISGFGTPAMIVVPILMSLGFDPIISVVISLIGGALPVAFGAAGLPIVYGMASVVGKDLALNAGFIIAMLNIITAIFVVMTIIFITSREKDRFRDVLKHLPFILFSSLAFSLSSFVIFVLFGPEMASILGGLLGMLFIGIYAFLFTKRGKRAQAKMSLKHYLSFSPYIIVALFLALTRIPVINSFIRQLLVININSIFGTGIAYVFRPLALSATVFILTAIFFFLYFFIKNHDKYIKEITIGAFQKIIKPATALICVVIFVQIMLNSGMNTNNFPSMAQSAGGVFHQLEGYLVIIVAPFIGALGAFITGSATVSNLLFSSIQQSTAIASGNLEHIILAMQGMGAAVGNVIGMHNILAALAIANIHSKLNKSTMETNNVEKLIIKTNLPFLIFYLLITGILGLIVSIIIK